ncbi:MAG: SBBP repeat-containing protein [Bacteroidetes bacterium]|nr:SBBP repeat-containing protein [Bacteroidota bacterium]
MKDRNYCFLVALFIIGNLFAGNNKITDPQIKARANEWLSEQTALGFIENKGQMADINGEPAPYVLFKTELPGLIIWVTTSGLTYQFLKSEEEKDQKERENIGSANSKVKQEDEFSGAWQRVDMTLQGASIKKENIITEGDITQGEVNYHLSHCPNGILNVKTYSKIIIHEVYPGIDWVLYTNFSSERDNQSSIVSGGLKHDFIVHPNADPNQVKFIYEGSGKLQMKRDEIIFENELGKINEGRLLCFQEDGSKEISSHYKRRQTNKKIIGGFSYQVSIEVGKYDPSQTLIIDPQLVWATYVGGVSVEGAMGVECDAAGNVFMVGYAANNGFPTLNSGTYYKGTFGGGNGDVFIVKFSAVGAMLWSTYFGSPSREEGIDLAIDNTGNVYIAGFTAGAGIPTLNAGGYFDNTFNGVQDFFILKFTNTGVLNWSTYYGGSAADVTQAITVDNSGNIYLTGYTKSTNFPTQAWGGAYYDNTQNGNGSFGYWEGDIFIVKFSSATNLIWSTYYGGGPWFSTIGGGDWGEDITIDSNGNIIVVGCTSSQVNFPIKAWGGAFNEAALGSNKNGFLLKFSGTGILLWATGFMPFGQITSVVTDSNDNIFVAGHASNLTPTTGLKDPGGGAYFQFVNAGFGSDVFIAKFSAAGILQWSTFYGGNGWEDLFDIFNSNPSATNTGAQVDVDKCDNVYLLFASTSDNLPTLNPGCGYFDNTFNGATNFSPGSFPYTCDHYIAEFSNAGILKWASYLGGDGWEARPFMDFDINGNLYIVGEWQSTLAFPPLLDPGAGAYFDNTFGGSDDGTLYKFVPDRMQETQSQVNSTSCVCNGTATVNITCGTVPFSYVWNNGSQTISTASATNTITGLCPGNYWVEIKDAACIVNRDTVYYTITGSSGTLTVAASATPAGCVTPGTATAIPTGGTGPYTYSWSSPVAQTTSTATGLIGGVYTITVTDAAGCKTARTVSVTQPILTVAATTNPGACNINNGSATATASGGVSPYIYTWSNNAAGQTATGLAAGNYTVLVTDVNGCTATHAINITQTTPVVTLNTTNSACGGMVYLEAIVSGGVMPYTYAWSTGGSSTPSIAVNAPGTYSVTVSDGSGCTSVKTINVAAIPPYPAIATFAQSPGGNICTGTTVNFTNTGTAPGTGVTYYWLLNPGYLFYGSPENFSYTFLSTGTYSVSHTVTNGGCSATVVSNIVVVNCTGPTVTTTGSSVCPGTCASVTSSGAGGTSPYNNCNKYNV